MVLAGAINTISPSRPDARTENLILTLIFLVLAVLLIHSILKSSKTKKQAFRPSTNTSDKIAYTYRASRTPVPVSPPVSPVSSECAHNYEHQSIKTMPMTNQDTLVAPFKRIPHEVVDLLWFLNGPFQNYQQDSVDWDLGFAGVFVRMKGICACDPSAIDVNLPLSSDFAAPTPLDYYPSYEALTPQQRTAYLNWLVDITMPIDIGYVFIFYYGVERHLFFGNANAALATIFVLRQFHENKSFQTYSGDAILLYALVHKKPEILQHLGIQQLSPDLRLFASAMVQHCLTAQDIIAVHKKFSFENTRYIKAEPELFLSTLENLLLKSTGKHTFEVNLGDFQSTEGTFTLALANYSLLPAQRFLSLPDISTAPRVHSSVHSLLVETHESVKIRLRELRKQSNGSKNSPTK